MLGALGISFKLEMRNNNRTLDAHLVSEVLNLVPSWGYIKSHHPSSLFGSILARMIIFNSLIGF